MALSIPATACCLIPDCHRPPTHKLALRMRRKDSGADWAPDSAAYFCTRHATRGANIVVVYEPTLSKEVTVSVAAHVARRTTAITRA